MADTHCKAIKSRNGELTEYLVYIKFMEPPQNYDDLLKAFLTILDQRIPWSKPDATKALLAMSGDEDRDTPH